MAVGAYEVDDGVLNQQIKIGRSKAHGNFAVHARFEGILSGHLDYSVEVGDAKTGQLPNIIKKGL